MSLVAIIVLMVLTLLPPIGVMPRMLRVKALPNATVVGAGSQTLNRYSSVGTYKVQESFLNVTTQQRQAVDEELTFAGFRRRTTRAGVVYEKATGNTFFYKRQWLRIDHQGRVHVGAGLGHWPYL